MFGDEKKEFGDYQTPIDFAIRYANISSNKVLQ